MASIGSINLRQPIALEVGSRLGHYTVTALIGEGGMGQFCQATDTNLNRQVGSQTNSSVTSSEVLETQKVGLS